MEAHIPSNAITSDAPCCLFDESNYDLQMAADFANARGRIIIVTPYLTSNAIERWDRAIRNAIKRGVRICIFVQEPRNWKRRLDGTLAEREIAAMARLDSAVAHIRSLDVHVTLRAGDHEKLIVVDDDIFWAGSLNLLSWFDTREWLRRVESRKEVTAMIEKYRLLPCDACPTKPKVRDLIRAKRKMLGLTQGEVAKRAGVTRKTVVRLELGVSTHIDLAEKICDALDLSLHVSPKHAEQACIQLSAEILGKTPEEVVVLPKSKKG